MVTANFRSALIINCTSEPKTHNSSKNSIMASDAEKEKLRSDINNQSCLLVEFINESDESNKSLVQTGYMCWLHEKDISNIEEVIDSGKVIDIYWPQSCDISTAATMRKKLKNVEFAKHPARILAHGEWVDMRKKQTNLEQYNLLSPTRSARKNLKRKDVDDENDKMSIQDSSTKAKKNLRSSFKLDEDLLSCTKLTSFSSQVINHGDIAKSSDDDTDVDSSGDDEGQSSGLLQILSNRDIEIEKKKEEIKELKDEISMLKNQLEIEKLNTEFMKNENIKIRNDLRDYKINNDYQSEYTSILTSTANDLHKIQSIINMRLSSLDKASASSSSILKQKSDDSLQDVTNLLGVTKHPEIQGNLNVKNEYGTQIVGKLKNRKYKNGNEPTDFVISQDKMLHVKTGSVPEFTNSILEVLFTDEELSSCSVTGTMSNVHKNMTPRPGLDKNRLAAARNLCYSLFHKKTKDWYKTFNYTARNKCNDMKKLYKQ